MTDTWVHQALDPMRSVVVEACAGSGKTWLLVSRIIRLLLQDDTPASQILAITFTRKAAQEMQARLNDWLRLLATAPEPEVRAFLAQRALDEREIDAALPRVRRLYERTVTARPGVTINTFHGWFLDLLQHAPLNFGASGTTALLEQTSPLIEEAWQALAEQLLDAPESPPALALIRLFHAYGLANTRKLLSQFLHKRAEWWIHTQEAADRTAFTLDTLSTALGVTLTTDLLAPLFEDELFEAALEKFAGLLEKNATQADLNHADLIRAALKHPDPGQRFTLLLDAFFTRKGEPYARKASQARTARLGAEGDEHYAKLNTRLTERLDEIRQAHLEQRVLQFNRDALHCGEALLAHYQRLKDERGALDFTDIEWHARNLLLEGDHAAYMQHKLDARYRHILLDEFQDTNPLQWQILQCWFEASVAAERHPTIFLVGDPKQSIYRFRGADARLFEQARHYLSQHFNATHCVQHTSWRSAQPVLDVVNRVFANLPEFAGFERHQTQQPDLPGQVWLLPLVPLPESDIEAAPRLRNPLITPRHAAGTSAHQHEAERIAQGIRDIVGHWIVFDKDARCHRLAEFRDIMLLARMRTHLRLYESALKAAGIPYRTARHGGLLDTLEVRDLTALLEFLVLPYADLKLAQVLRSPLFDASDADLLTLTQDDGSWWGRLCRLQGQHHCPPALQRAQHLLAEWRRAVDRLPVHDLLDRIYHEGDVLARYRRSVPPALCESVQANLLQFLELSLTLEGGRYPSLPKFIDELAVLRRARDEETPDEGEVATDGNTVQLYTVHGAKGLERPVVWILDANRVPPAKDAYGALVDWAEGADRPAHFSFVATREERGRARQPFFEREAVLQRREELNLLYVALTRAQQYLIVSGIASRTGTRPSWYALLQAQLAPSELTAPAVPHAAAPIATAPVPMLQTADPRLLASAPACGLRQADIETPAMREGTLLHRLLERITPPAPIKPRAVIQLELGLSPVAFDALWDEAQRIIQAPELVPFFDPVHYQQAWNELPFVTATGDVFRIDRLVVLNNEWWVLDYKSNTAVTPTSKHQAAKPYLGQVRGYVAAIRELFPGQTVRGALIFKQGLWVEVAA